MNSIKDKIKKISKWFFGTKKRRIIFSLLFVLLIIAPLSFYFYNKKAGASWWNSDWNYRRSITINSAQIPADLTNYPMLVSFTDSNLINKTQADGGDIIFIQENGTRLDHEIERFDSTTGELVAWVKIPQLDGDNDSIIYMYYDNQTVDNQQRPEDVWDDGFKTVQHLEEGGTGTRYDSTRNNKDGTPTSYEGAEATTGKIGGADDFDGTDNIDLGADIFKNADLTNGSISLWIKSDTLDTSARSIFAMEGIIDISWSDYLTTPTYNLRSYIYSGLSPNQAISTTSLTTGVFDHIFMTWDGVNMRLYKNGVLVDTDIIASPNLEYYNNNKTRIGSGHSGNNFWDGIIDEVRISSSARSANWITTEYNNQNSPSTFISLGQEERGFSPALYLPFDEGFGTTAHDETSNHNDGSIVGATWKDESNCKSGKCLEFDGTGDYVEINDNKSLDLSEEVTLEAWVKPQSTTPNNQTIISKVETPTDPTKIYRSVGPSATGALATGTATNHLTIVGDKAVFAQALPDNVGVGDAIQYDDDDDGDIDTNDSIVFIKQRVTSYEFLVATANGGVPTSVNADTNWSLFRAYTSLANAESGTENTGIDADLVNFDTWSGGKDIVASNEQWNIACYANGTTSDATAITVDSWTTGVNSFIRIYTPVSSSEVGVSQRHVGRWDTNKYYLYISTVNNPITVSDSNIKVDGIQIGTNNSSGSVYGYALTTQQVGLELSNSIIRNFGIALNGIYLESSSDGSLLTLINNIVYNFSSNGIFEDYSSGTRLNIYNSTIYNCGNVGIRREQATIYVKNTIVQNCTDGYAGTFDASSNYNISNLAADAPGANSKNSTTVSFISTTVGSEDFHLAPTDTAAKNSGADLSGDNIFPFNSDIDGQTRLDVSNPPSQSYGVARWDVGADEARATQIYRSVAPGKTDTLETGTENSLTIAPANGSGASGYVATFQRALADNIGVGDVIQYDDDGDSDIDANDSLVFISGRVSSYEFLVTTASGGVPTQIINDNEWSLFRAYTSLANAESGDENTGIDSDLRNFDSWTGGKDLVTSKEQWNIACYANGTTADTTAVVVDGWTTDVQSFVKIYTPVNESEVGVSQRHNGEWDEYKFKIVRATGSTIIVRDENARVQGLQIEITLPTGQTEALYFTGATGVCNYEASNNIIRSNEIAASIGEVHGLGLWASGSSGSVIKIFSNIVYGFKTGSTAYVDGIFTWDSDFTYYVYNNTVYGCDVGIDRGDSPVVILKNNLVQNCRIAYDGTFDASSDYNISSDASNPGSGTHNKINISTVAFVDGSNDDFHLSKTDTVARDAGVNLSNDPNLPINSDIDGEERETFDIGADEAVATKIYRSVGPNNTTTLATDEGHENSVVVSSGIASFSANIPDNVGVGDAVLIDTNSDNNITSADTLLFISKRNSATSYHLQATNGSVPGDISANDTYQIFRAYTSLANAESGTKNTSIPITFNGGNRDLVTNNEEWNIACYGDGVDTATLTVDGWITGGENYINIYTPVGVTEVGISQRHNGKWDDTKYSLAPTINSNSLIIQDDFVRLEGLQIKSTSYNATNRIGIYANNIEGVYIGGNIIKEGNITQSGRIGISIYIKSSATFSNYVYNNIVYNFTENNIRTNGSCLIARQYIINNTCINAGGYSYDNFSGTTAILKNNLNYGTFSDYCPTGVNALSTNNAYVVTSPAGASNSKNISAYPADSIFVDPDNEDFRLAMTDTAVKGAGLNLSNDTNLPVTSDIEGELRPNLRQGSGVAMPSFATSYQLQPTNYSYDIGADQISSTIHNNYSLNLKTNYPQANFSIADNDKDNFSSGDINLEANTWSHIAYKRSNDIEELYINGSKKDSSSISNFLKTNNGKLYLGSNNTSSKNSFKGLLDEIKIYPYARTESEIKKDKVAGSSGRAASRAQEGIGVSIGDTANNLSDGLVGYWKMDEASWTGAANEVKDVSGNNNHGVRSGNATTGVGKFGNGGAFDGTGDYAQTSQPVNMSTGFSVSSWARVENNSLYNQLGMVGADALDSNNGFVMEYRDAGSDDWLYIRIGTGSSDTLNFSDECYLNWCQYAFTYEPNGNVIGYVNGKKIGSFQANSNFNISSRLNIGQANSGNDEYFNGKIDETRIYNRTLSEDEVQQLYNYAPGPVLHLKMDEKSGITAYDSSGFDNHGTLSGGPIWETGKINGGAFFPDDGRYLNVPSSLSIKSIDYNFTIAGWFKGDSAQIGKPMISSYEGYGTGSFTMSFNGSGIFSANSEGTGAPNLYSTVRLDDNEWHYFSYVRDASNLKSYLYVDGILNDSDICSAAEFITYQTGQIFIPNQAGDFRGSIDDVKVYNYARTQEQILEDMGASAGASTSRGTALKSPVLDLSFDEGQGPTAFDASGNENNGTLVSGATGTNTTTTAMWDKGGKFGGAMEFDGTNDYVQTSDSQFDFERTDSFTLSAWVKTGLSNGFIFSKQLGSGNWTGYNFYIAANALGMDIVSDTSPSNYIQVRGLGSSGVTDNQWHHVVATYDGSSSANGVKLYVDSFEDSLTANVDTLTSSILNNVNLDIGYRSTEPGGAFNGKIDEVKVYNYVLGEDEIKTLYNDSSAMVMGNDESRDNNGTAVTGANKDYCVPGDSARCDKPVLELKMDEMSGSTANDTSGNGNNGTISGALWEPNGKIGSALKFDGVNNEVSIAGVDLPAATSWTIDAWIFDESTNSYANWIGRELSSSYISVRHVDSNVIVLRESDGTVRIFTVPGGYGQYKGKWTHHTYVAEGSSVKLYLNGVYISEVPIGSTEFYIDNIANAYYTSGHNFEGSIDEIRIYGYARTPAQIAWDYNRGEPVGHWKMDESSGTQVDDWSGRGNHGTLNGATRKNESECKNGKCLSFDGVNDYVSYSSAGLDSYPISFSTWVKPNVLAQNGIVLAFDGTNVDQSFGIYNDGDKILISNNMYGLNGVTNYLTAQKWQHWTVVFESATTFHFYLDGVEIPLVNVSDRYDLNGTAFGARNNGTERQFNGSIDDVKIYNYALTPLQVKLDYNNSSAVNFK